MSKSSKNSNTTRFVKIVSPLAVAIALAACGGDSSFGSGDSGSKTVVDNTTKDDANTGGTTSTTEVEVSSLDVSASSTRLISDGSKSVEIKALAKDKNNRVIGTAKYEFSVDKDATLLENGGTATLTLGGAKEGEVLTVTVKSGDKTETIKITVVKAEEVVAPGEVAAHSFVFSASSRELQSDGTKPVTISVVTKDKNNNLLKGATVNFSVDKDANIEVNPSTGAVHTAVLTPGSAENRALTVTATSGSLTKTIKVEVVGTTVVIDGPEAITFGKTLPYVLKLKDSGNKPLAYKDVELTSKNGNVISTTGQTNAKGEIEFDLTGTYGGSDSLTAKALGAEFVKDVKISGDEFTLTGNLDDVSVGTNNTLTIEWKNNGTPQANKTISINATRGALSTASITTDNDGKATFTISSPKAGQTVVTVTTPDGLSTSLKGEFVAITPKYLNTQADPKLIAPKGTSTIVAKIRDLADNPVKNKTIIFNLEDTVNGSLSQGSAITDSLGRATVSYTAGDASSAKDGVVIKTYVQSAPTIADEIKLTVGGKALRIVLGHDHLVAADEVFYTKTYGVIVTDSAGNPIKDQNIDFTITPTKYYKGYLKYIEEGDDKEWRRVLTDTCPSEDFDNDGNLDAGEDVNNNGKLEPTHDAAVTGSGVTDENGKITVQVVYPKSRAWWSDQAIEASTTVGGTEYLERTEFTLPVLAADVNTENSPPNAESPYGIWGSCSDDPAGTPPVAIPASNPPVVRIVESASGSTVGSVRNSTVSNNWYAVTIDGIRAVQGLDYIINDSGKVSIQTGPNNDFKLTDNNPLVDDSGFYISITTNKTTERPLSTQLPVFYQDDAGSTESSFILLNGGYKDGKATTITLNKGETYVEYGATAKTRAGADLGVTVYGSVDTSVVGTTVVVYVAVDNYGKTVTTTRTVVVKDSDVPVITLIGGDISHPVGTNLPVDGSLSASATDASDGDLSGAVKIDSSAVQTAILGTYYIYYSVTDFNGNTAVARRTVTVQ